MPILHLYINRIVKGRSLYIKDNEENIVKDIFTKVTEPKTTVFSCICSLLMSEMTPQISMWISPCIAVNLA